MNFNSLFDDPNGWQVFASGHAKGKTSAITSADSTPGLRLEYDFHGGGGFIVIRRAIELSLPNTFEIGFLLRGEGPPNHFEFKVASPGGLNVWRHLRQHFHLPAEWSDFRFHERDFPFAWGPAGGGAPTQVEAVELVIAAGPGGKGFLELSHASMEDQTLRVPKAVTASSFLADFPPHAVLDHGQSGWKAAADDVSPWWAVDFGRRLRFGGMVIHWPEGLPPRDCVIEVSDDGSQWTVLHQMGGALGPRSHISAHGGEARHLRVLFHDHACAAISLIDLKPDAYSSTPNEFIHAVAADYPRGWYPRYWHREQSYWTPVGCPEGKRRALINEEGMVEVDEGGFSLEPFILTGSGMISWADVKTSCAMAKDGIPVPSVAWESAGLCLDILPWLDGIGEDLTLRVTYRLKATLPHDGMQLVLVVRPFQVNPPWQAFRNLGGCSPIKSVTQEAHGMRVNERLVFATPPPACSGAAMFDENGALGFLSQGMMPPAKSIEDSTGLASAAMSWELASGEGFLEVTVSVPYFVSRKEPALASREQALAQWEEALGLVQWQVPDCAKSAFDCMRTAAGHILINRDGAAIQPGPRRYTRSWVRDCVVMGAALAKAGQPHALDEFIRWYAQFQREDGFIPCVVDRDGVDWLVEHDSHGQFLWGVREVFRAMRDAEFLTNMAPHVRKAANYLLSLRASRMTGDCRSRKQPADYGLLPESVSLQDDDTLDARSEFFGLLPESASHEGYLAHPVHSYWDDFWGVRGLQAAADMAEIIGLHDDAENWRREAECFQNDLLLSLNRVISEKNLNYIPGSVEWADYDPTATANAIGLLDFASVLPQGPMHATLGSYLDGHRLKHGGGVSWNNYSAYEIRIIGAFVRLGKRETANELLDFFLSDRRPREWNQWPEITWSDSRSPGHLGDVPHTWIAAEYILSLGSMVADEREASSSLVLAPGMPWKWISEIGGFYVRRLPTRYGLLDFRIHASSDELIHVEVSGSMELPPGGLWVVPPLPEGKRIVSAVSNSIGSVELVHSGKEIQIHALPCVVELRLGSGGSITPA